MTTTTSYSDSGRFKALYRSALRRSMGYFGLFSVLLLIFYPFQYALRIFRDLTENQQMQIAAGTNPMDVYSLAGMGKQFTIVSAFFYTMIILVVPIVLALVLNNYMHSKKAADVFHALPVKREMLLGINTAVAMTIITIPVLASNLLIILFQTIKFGFQPFLVGQILLDMAGWLISAFFIYLLTTVVCTLVGTVFDAFIFSGILMASTPVILGIYTALATEFLFGFQPNEIFLQTLLDLCPLTVMPTRLSFTNYVTQSGFKALNAEQSALLLNSNIAIVVFLLLAVVLLFAAMWLYRRRNSEKAETTTSKGPLQVIVKFIGTLIGGITIGLIFYGVNGEDSASADMMFVMWSLIGGILIYTIIEVILNRGFKSLIKSIPMGVVMVAVMSASTLVILMGGFGYENRVPDVENIESLEISYMGRFDDFHIFDAIPIENSSDWNYQTVRSVKLTDPEMIAAVVNYHQEVVDVKYQRDYSHFDEDQTVYADTSIKYHLKNGKTMQRNYNVVKVETLMKLAVLETNAEFLAQTHPAFFIEPKLISKWMITDAFGGNKVEQIYSEQESVALLEAIKADLLDQTSEELLYPTDHILAVVMFNVERPKVGGIRSADNGYFYITSEQQRTWQILNEKGLIEQLKPDLSKCSAVVAEYPNTRSRTAIFQLSPYDSFLNTELEYIREDLERQKDMMREKEYGYDTYDYPKSMYGENVRIYEEQALIEQMAQQVVATGAINEPMVSLRFFFDDSEEGSVVAIPLSELPQNVQLELKTSMLK